MATPEQWWAGARPRTLPAALAPVLAGTAVAAHLGTAVPGKALLALVVALALQVGVNYANDYSDGVRGTDADRVGPQRLVGSGAAGPAAVRRAAFGSFGVACLAGLVLAATTAWWLVALGAACVAAAWFYTGGARPYGYAGLGELVVFVFFGLVAVQGTVFVQAGALPLAGWLAAVSVGAVACALLVANNLRDVPSDRLAGKRTLAVRVGDARTRYLYALLVAVAAVTVVGLALAATPWALVALAFLVPAGSGVRRVLAGASGRDLVPVLGRTGVAELVLGVGLFTGLVLG